MIMSVLHVAFKHLSVGFFSLSVLTAIGSRLSGTRMSPFLILLELRMMKVVVMTAGAIRGAKLKPNWHHQQTNTQLLQAECPSCRPTNSVKALKVS